MGSTAVITPASVEVDPGGQALCELRVRNTGTIVDQFDFEALGEAAPWATFTPASISLLPETEGVTTVSFRPPRSAEVAAGPCPVGVRVRSKEDPDRPTVEELTLDIGPFADVSAELIPRTGRGSRGARYRLAIDNRGNNRFNANLSAADPDDLVRFRFNPPASAAEPGTAVFARLTARPLKRFLRGPDVTHPFTALVQPDGQEPLAVPGTLVQEAVIPRWAPRAALAALAAALVLVLLWFAVLKPTVRSTAQDAVDDKLTPALQQTSKQIGDLAKKIGTPAPPPVTVAPNTETPTTLAPTGTAALGDPFDGRLEATADNQTVSFKVDDGKIFSLTDVVLQNPQGDGGLMRLERGDNNLLVVRLDNFRDLDYHFVAPVVFRGGQQLTLKVACQNPAAPPKPCTPAVYFTGFQRSG